MKNAENPIGKAIAACRKAKKWSQQALGNKFLPRKSASEISRWERNIVTPSAKHMTELLTILGEKFSLELIRRRTAG